MQMKLMKGRTFGHLARSQRVEGMTLVEIMIVVVIMALIATAVGVAVLPALENAKIEQTTSDAQAIRSAAILHVAMHSRDCPTVADLVESESIDASKNTADAWDGDFVIECEGRDIIVTSGGPDGEMGTEDDISTAANSQG